MCVLIEWHTLCLLINHKKTDLGVLPQRVLDCYLYNTTVLHPIGLAATKVITQLESNIKTQQIERTNAVTLHKYLKTYVIVKMLRHIDFVSGGNSNHLSIELHITNHWLFSTWVFDPSLWLHCFWKYFTSSKYFCTIQKKPSFYLTGNLHYQQKRIKICF